MSREPQIVNLAASVSQVEISLTVAEGGEIAYQVIGPDAPQFAEAVAGLALDDTERAKVLQTLDASRGQRWMVRTLGRPERKVTVYRFGG